MSHVQCIVYILPTVKMFRVEQISTKFQPLARVHVYNCHTVQCCVYLITQRAGYITEVPCHINTVIIITQCMRVNIIITFPR